MKQYNKTIFACYVGYITQAIVNNFAPLLFVTFKHEFGIALEKIAVLITINFGLQLLIDLFAARYADKIGYRRVVVMAHVFCGLGMILLGIMPFVMENAMWGLLIGTSLYALGGGLIEVIISPIVEYCPSERKAATMSLLHSFYCWGQMGVVLLSTLYFVLFGTENWRYMAFVWALVPLANSLLFLFVPIVEPKDVHGDSLGFRRLMKMKLFWIFVILMLCAGASELTMSQWASAFVEESLGLSKSVGDLAGPCMFALFMGSGRVFYARKGDQIGLEKFMLVSAALCVLSYLITAIFQAPALALLGCALCGLSVGIMWPGTYSIASKHCPSGGTAMFAFLALAGDLGCMTGPSITGVLSGAFHGDLRPALSVAAIFPVLLIVGLIWLRRNTARKKSAS